MDPILKGEDLRKYFGSVRAVDGVSFHVSPRETLSIIGPNGAGKTTLLNLVSGIIKPDSGRVLVRKGDKYIDITGWGPAKITKLGIARAFQVPNIFSNMTVIDNIRAALIGSTRIYSKTIKPYYAIPGVEEEAWKLLEFFDLAEKAETLAVNLSHGEKKVLDIALALVSKPSILLLDEPTAGLSAIEKPFVTKLLGRIKEEAGVAIVVVEHDLDVVFEVSDRVMVLYEGRLLSEGTPAEVKKDPVVKEVYLGEEA